MIAFVFPGQGSQKRGMGEALFDSVPEYRSVEKEVDTLVGYSMRELCSRDPGGRLRQTQFTQPCLYVVNALYYSKAIAEGKRPSFLAGHSLGEYNALLAAGAMDFLTGLRLVKKRGELMMQSRNGAMAAVIGLADDVVTAIARERGLSTIDVANLNSPTQVVLSGPEEDIRRSGPIFEAAGAQMYLPLPVGGAFHSRYMTQAASEFAEFLAPFRFEDLQTPVVSNVTARLYPMHDSSESIKSLLTRQITLPVLWTQSVRHLMDRGVHDFLELGPGNVLTRLVQQIRAVEEARDRAMGSITRAAVKPAGAIPDRHIA